MSAIRLLVFASIIAAVGACASSQSQIPAAVAQPCAAHVCRLVVINHDAIPLSIIYKDSTGRSEDMGRVAGASSLALNLTHIHAGGVRVFAIDRDRNIYAADFIFPLSGPMEVHFPDDFVTVDDTVMPRRPPS